MPDPELTILMPCLNEAATLAICIRKARTFLALNHIDGEIIIADNGSTDGSLEIALAERATIVSVPTVGYGSALIAGISSARGRYIIMADSDDSYNFLELGEFLSELRAGTDLVIGNRFRGGIAKGAMPPLHKYLGNPALSFIGRLLFNQHIGDFHCGLRGFNRAAILALGLNTSGMEFASEMIVKASLARLKISEVPTTLSRDGRNRPPHLRSWQDGWRHLRFLLLYCPRWLFLYPGLVLLSLGSVSSILLISNPISFNHVGFDIHTLLYASSAAVIGFQLTLFSLLTQLAGARLNMFPPSKLTNWLSKKFRLELAVIPGILVLIVSLWLSISSVRLWELQGFSRMDPSILMRSTIPATSLAIASIEWIVFCFFLTFLQFSSKK